jgi:hypothetical protein
MPSNAVNITRKIKSFGLHGVNILEMEPKKYY